MLPLKTEYPQPHALHFAAHSHHPRPLVTREATLQCWNDAATMLDSKWDHIFGSVVPEAQRNVAKLLSYDHPSQVAFAPNTHEFVARILSSFDPTRPLRVLTTSSEFLSFSRQIDRLKERGNVSVTEVPVFPYDDFVSRFVQASQEAPFDLIYFSQVFFDSGFRIGQKALEDMVVIIGTSDAAIVIDGYHGFCAVPTSLKTLGHRTFYLAGGYKYAQWGEGACFLCVPPGCTLRPENTGWFATFGALHASDNHTDHTQYSDDAFRFWGSTFDPAGLYRLNAVAIWLRDNGISVEMTRRHILDLQSHFLDGLWRTGSRIFGIQNLVTPADRARRGYFLSFDLKDARVAAAAVRALSDHGVMVDSRGSLVRIGFGMYHDRTDVDVLLQIICGITTTQEENAHA